jgi:hypothetical protein
MQKFDIVLTSKIIQSTQTLLNTPKFFFLFFYFYFMICRYAKLCFYHQPQKNSLMNLDENDNEVEISNYRPISDNELVQMQVPRVDSAQFRL